MAEGKKSFLLYCDSIGLVSKMPDESAGKLLKHLFSYVNDENPETDDPFVDMAFEHFKQYLKRDLKKFENKKEERSKSAQFGNLKKYQPDLYQRVKDNEFTLEYAVKLAKSRKTSLSDNSDSLKERTDKNLAVSDSVSESDSVRESTIVDENDIVETSEKIKQIEVVYNSFIKQVKNGEHTQWAESTYMQLGLKKGSLTKLIQDFKNHLIRYAKVHPNISEFRKHLNSWLNQLDKIGKLNQYKKKAQGAL